MHQLQKAAARFPGACPLPKKCDPQRQLNYFEASTQAKRLKLDLAQERLPSKLVYEYFFRLHYSPDTNWRRAIHEHGSAIRPQGQNVERNIFGARANRAVRSQFVVVVIRDRAMSN
jgi:hypothetical protein